jgi:hypothetical protein
VRRASDAADFNLGWLPEEEYFSKIVIECLSAQYSTESSVPQLGDNLQTTISFSLTVSINSPDE